MRAFAYARPTGISDAVALLAAGSARPLAGGTDLIIRLRDGTIRPDVVVDVKQIRELDGSIREDGDKLVIGALAVMTDIAAHHRIRRDFTALAEAAAVVGAVQIRNRATLAGNICNASPAADTLPALLIFGAVIVAQGTAGTRRIPLDELLVRSGVTTVAADELVTAVELPLPAERRGSVHLRRTRRRGHDLAAVTVAATTAPEGGLRIAYGSVGPRPLLVTHDGTAPLDDVFAAATPSPRSMRASPEYRLAMLRVLGQRAVDSAIARRAAQ
jgi:carbon-monoxide dehydrogenase medium subunit